MTTTPAKPAIPVTPPAATGLTAFVHKLEVGFAKDEQWVVAEFTKGWQLLQSAEKTAQVDIENIFHWIAAHQSTLLAALQEALSAASILGNFIPGAGPTVAAATLAINAATEAVNVLSKSVLAGSTPLSTAVSAYHAVKDAQTAVNAVLKASTTKPPTVSAAAAAAPVTPVKS
jgi:hypothetical protein